MISNILLNKIVTRQHDFCCICLKTIQGTPINIEDEVVLKDNVMKIQDVLSLVLGYEICNNISVFEILCKACTHAAVDCLNFIMTTKETSELLNKAICNLSTCLDKTVEPSHKDKTLYLTIDTCNMESKHYFYHKTANTSNIALKRLHNILHSKPKIKKEIKKEYQRSLQQNTQIEIDPNTVEMDLEDDLQEDTKPKRKRSYFSIPMKTKEMLCDKTDCTTFKCKVCLKFYPSLTSLRNHYIRVHAPKNHKCRICSKKFASLTLLEAHKKLSHCTVVCSECGKTYHNRHSLKMHEIGHHFKIVCEGCGRVYKSQTTYKKHLDLNICGQNTRALHANAQFTCDYCNKKYTQKVSLRVHIQYEHCNYKGHICKWCNKSFYAQSRLKAHILKHTQEKNFPCDICGGRFISKESLLYHTRIHTGERPYKCDLCSRRFLSASRRSDHFKRHHSGSVTNDRFDNTFNIQWQALKSE
ncbi:zinc finger protein 510 [Bicyclus anynana]|uniref:Zinc finger protein 510 n=1 Tax=Bicyclus anynana TaxID=110368 RepID=A0A6J1MRV4_BICAN|nr:zinc finger protein 510 [Bicyclus anynana]